MHTGRPILFINVTDQRGFYPSLLFLNTFLSLRKYKCFFFVFFFLLFFFPLFFFPFLCSSRAPEPQQVVKQFLSAC